MLSGESAAVATRVCGVRTTAVPVTPPATGPGATATAWPANPSSNATDSIGNGQDSTEMTRYIEYVVWDKK